MSSHFKNPGRYFFVAFCLILAIIFADQYSKWMVMEELLRIDKGNADFLNWFITPQKFVAVMALDAFKTITVTPWLNIVMVWNKGISFGLFDTGSQMMSLVFVSVSVMVSLLMIIWLALSQSKILSFSLALIVGGAVGNVLDRLRFGAVVDFIDVHVAGQHWPAFNVADGCIVFGAVLLALDMMFRGDVKERK